MVDSLWDGAINTLKPFDEKIIHIVEEKLQLKLPADYVSLMKQKNGGRLTKSLYRMNEEEIFVEELLGISEEDDEGILTTIYMRKEWELPENIILLSGDGHSWVFLDYRKNREQPSVSYIDLEMEEDYVLADNFTDFLNGLYVDETIEEDGDGAEGVYSEEEFEKIVEEADDPFALTDGVLYFTEIDCDMDWLITQITLIMDIDNDESEFVLPELLDYLMNRISKITLDDGVNKTLQLLALKVESHQLQDVQNYYQRIMKIIR